VLQLPASPVVIPSKTHEQELLEVYSSWLN
jgi:hypothetical protein